MTGEVEEDREAGDPREAPRARIRRLERAGMVLGMALVLAEIAGE